MILADKKKFINKTVAKPIQKFKIRSWVKFWNVAGHLFYVGLKLEQRKAAMALKEEKNRNRKRV
jgi:hypothetical protein